MSEAPFMLVWTLLIVTGVLGTLLVAWLIEWLDG